MNKGLDFICIGAQKAGTSWLHWNLLFHPQTSMPPTKEVNFFYRHFNFKNFLSVWSNPHFWRSEFKHWRKEKKYGGTCSLLNWFIHRFHWYQKYMTSACTSANYVNLFSRRSDTITGDISPSYADLSEQYIAELGQLLPATKIIYLLRNPIDRAWSQYKMDNPEMLSLEDDALSAHMQKRGGICEHSCYDAKLAKWSQHFPERLRVWFYDELCTHPEKLFKEICEFLEIEPTINFQHSKIHQKIFAGATKKMPDEAREYLTTLLLPELRLLHARFNNTYTEKWLLTALK